MVRIRRRCRKRWRQINVFSLRINSLLWRRVFAYFVDALIIFALFAALHLLIWFGTGGRVHGAVGALESPLANWLWVFLINTAISGALYLALCESSAWRATLGKRLTGLRIANANQVNGVPVSFGRAYGRALVKLIPWETFHVALMFFGVQTSAETPLEFALILPQYAVVNGIGWLLIVVYLALAAIGDGRTVHDFVAVTVVKPAQRNPLLPNP